MTAQQTRWQARWRRAAKASGLLTLALCFIGMAQSFTGLEVAETCLLGEAQDFDPEYFDAHHRESPLPPYSSPCTAEYDMVPGWVNPAIAVTAASCALSTAGLAAARGAWRAPSGRGPLR